MYGKEIYNKFKNNEEVKEQDIIDFFNIFQDKFKCAVRESVMNKYKQYTRTIKLIYNYILAINRLLGSNKSASSFGNIKNMMKELQKNNKSIDTDLNYMISSINNITKSNYTFDSLTKDIIRRNKTMASIDEKAKINNLLRTIVPSDLIQLDFDEIMNIYEVYKRVGFRLIKYIKSQFSFNKDYKLKREMETMLATIKDEKPKRRIIRKGMSQEQIEKIKEEEAQQQLAGEKSKKKIRLLQPKASEKKEEIEEFVEPVIESIKLSETTLTEEDQMINNFEKFIARIQTFIDNYIRYKLEIKVKKDDIKPSGKRLYFEKDLEEGELDESSDEEISSKVVEELKPTSIKFSDVVADIVPELSKQPSEVKEEEKKDIYIEEQPNLVFGGDKVEDELDIDALAADIEQAMEEDIDII
jgi:hypothetical protein